ncbi:MAG: PAS domain-containing protein, partial [Ferruginibacter sp.]
MNRLRNVRIKTKIYWSFFLLVLLFVVNGIASLITLNNNRKLSEYVSSVTNPSLQSFEDFEDILIASKMYTTNWVFLRSNQDDKDALKHLHDIGYPRLKIKLNGLSLKWEDKNMTDSLHEIFAGFERLLVIEKKIMSSLQKFEDYDDPVIKLDAEMLVEDELLPRTSSLTNKLAAIILSELNIRNQKNNDLEQSFMELRKLITVLAITIIVLGIFLSLYMAKLIIHPLNKIRQIINNLGKGIIGKENQRTSNDEIGEMIHSVNNLSGKLQDTATFAAEIGNRNFTSFFEPLSSQDTLGKALIAMRDNIKSGDEKLNEAQHIAHIGSWERDIKTDKVTFSDEMFNIYDLDPATFDFETNTIFKLIHPDDLAYAMDVISKNKDREPLAFDCRIITPKGNKKNVFVHTKLVNDEHGKVVKTFGIVQDITERKQSEAKLAEERELFRLVIENIPDQIYLKDIEGRFMLCNLPVAINAGCTSQAAMIGKTDFDFYPPEMAQQCFIDEQNIVRSGQPLINKEQHLYDKITAKSRWSLDTKFPLRNNAGNMIGLIGINHDITGRKIAEQELEEVNRELNTLFNSVDEVFFSVNMATLKVIQVSATCEKLYGYNQSEFLANYQLWLNIIHPDDKHLIEDEAKMMQRGDPINNQYRIIHKDTSIRWV